MAIELAVGPERETGRTSERFSTLRFGAGLPGRLRLRTLVLIRWVAIFGQAFTILLVHFSFGFELPLGLLLGAVALSAAINLPATFAHSGATRLSERSAALLLAFDILQLGFLLALTGGLQNPFAILLLMPVILSATALSLGTTVLLGLLSINLVTALALVPAPLPWPEPGLALPRLYIFGLWAGFVLAICLVAAYAWRVAEESRRLADALAATQVALAREQQLSALGALAAATAHELGSPLTTIAVTARELHAALPADSPLCEEAAELLAQTQRCREILAQLGRRHEPSAHEMFTRAPFGDHLQQLADEYRRPDVAVVLAIEGDAAEPHIVLTPELRHGLGNLIDNAVGFARSRVVLRLELGDEDIRLRIQDDGPGFAPEVLERIGEPYFSTRRETGGLGLGVFIATTLLTRTGARVAFDNQGVGAQVTINWRRHALETRNSEREHE